MINESFLLWGGFTLFIAAMLALDLGVFHRRSHVITMKEALGWFGVWTALALIFNVGVILFHERGGQAGLEFFTGYLVEKSLSIDNIFVFILIFGYFNVPQTYQHKVLFWGIIGAIILRICFIVGGLALMERFHWMIYLFGSFLLLTGIQMIRKKEEKTNPEDNWVVRTFRRFFPVSDRYDGSKFFTRIDGRLVATPLFVVLLAVESSDIIFAVDSIPAIFAITQEPFLVYTSNIFAMLGLRALYFAVAGFMRMFHFLHYGFASIILILGVKMLISDFYKVPVQLSLVLILVILLVCVIVSLLRPRRGDLKMMFERTEKLGLMPFRRLLLIENIVDLGDITVRDSMRHRSGVRAIRLDLPWEQNLALVRETSFSRYPLMENESARPVGVLHVKDLFLHADGTPPDPDRLRRLARPCATLSEDLPLDDALMRFQRAFHHFALVNDARGEWSGILTIEDVLEELVGKIGDEFDAARSGNYVSLADALTPGRVIFGIQGNSMAEAVKDLLSKIPESELPGDNRSILAAVLQREAQMATYLGKGLAIPHCRLESLEKPALLFGRSEDGIPLENSNERAELIFLLLTPGRMARIQPRLLADIVGLVESDYVTERLKTADEPAEVIATIRDGQQVVLD
jgi:tellurite resistance protein TerC